MPQVAVYTYTAIDRRTGQGVAALRLGTPEAIRRVKGIADLESKQFVDECEIDSEGFYSAAASSSSAA